MSPLRIRIRFIQACGILWMLCAAAAMPARQVEAATTTAAATTGPDVCGYPDNSNLPRTGAIFNESGVLRAFSPVSRATTAVGQGLTIKMWYNDEHALTLGVRRVVVKSSSGTTTTNYPFTATPSSPTSPTWSGPASSPAASRPTPSSPPAGCRRSPTSSPGAATATGEAAGRSSKRTGSRSWAGFVTAGPWEARSR